mmetsp:Transcript_65685/g.152610  ORF Transcript_65685/g.152610 Transcript_65685/m.152610 type:complete len:125 (+) Transcript_65685:62-436(+)
MAVAATITLMRQHRLEPDAISMRSSPHGSENASLRLETTDCHDVAPRPSAWYERLEQEVLADGQVVALQGRYGNNGSFAKGDIGQATWKPQGIVQIVWPDGSQTSTLWPNLAWYRGRPCAVGAA